MDFFRYRAVDPVGNNFKGNIYAEDIADARQKLMESGFIVLELDKLSAIKKYIETMGSKKISIKYISIFCRQMQIIIKSGVSVLKGLVVMRSQAPNKKIHAFLDRLYNEVQKGRSLSEALQDSRFQVPFLLVNMVAIGEESGDLEDVLLRMAVYYEKEVQLKSKIIGAMIYPAIMALVSVGLVIFFLTFVMPEIMGVFDDVDDLPGITLLIINISDFVQENLALIIAGLAITISIIKVFVPADLMKAARGYVFSRIPLVKDSIRDIVTTRFLRNFGLLLRAGVPIISALQSVNKIIDNLRIKKIMDKAIEGVKRGERLGDNFATDNYFDPVVIHMINIGQETGELVEILETVSEYYEREAENKIMKLTAAMEPLLIVVLGVVMGILVIAMVLPMFDMIGNIQGQQ